MPQPAHAKSTAFARSYETTAICILRAELLWPSAANTYGLVCWVLLLTGCSATLEQLKDRATFDLQCSENQLRLTRIDDRTYGVAGCGKRATYVDTCDQLQTRADCTWVLNADLTRDSGPRPYARTASVASAAVSNARAPEPGRRVIVAQNEASRRLELEVAQSTGKRLLRYTSLVQSRQLKECRELGLTTPSGRQALPAKYHARLLGTAVVEALESELSGPVFSALEEATALDACGQSLTLSASFLAGVRAPPLASTPVSTSSAAGASPALRLELENLTWVLEADAKDPTGPIRLRLLTTVRPASGGTACPIKVLRDAEPVELGSVEHREDASEHEYRTQIAPTIVEQLGTAQRIVGKVCEQRFQLSEQHIAKLREFVLRVREERELN